MTKKRILPVAAALWVTAAAAIFAASAQMGTWKLDEAKSKFSPGATKNTTVTYEAQGDKIMLTVDGMDKDGKAVHWTWMGKFDGKPYKVEGNPEVDTMTFHQVDDHTNKLTSMKDDKVVTTGTVKVAKDGKSRVVTSTMTGPDGKKHTDKAYYTKE